MVAHRTGLALVSLAFVGASLAPTGTATAHDVPTCDGQPATLVGTSGNDHLRGTPGDDVIVGLGGNDRIHGRGGDDVMCGGTGDDRLDGGKGDDTMLGQAGVDVLDDEGGGISVMKAGRRQRLPADRGRRRGPVRRWTGQRQLLHRRPTTPI